jgi:hypothetical protein
MPTHDHLAPGDPMTRLIVAVAACAALAACTDSRCSKSNCHTLINSCRLEPAGMPNILVIEACQARFDGGTFDLDQECADACNSGGDGEIVQCLANHPECGGFSDGGQEAAINACSPASGTFDQACGTTCDNDRKTCESGCASKTSFNDCSQCASDCGNQFASCDKKCSH